MDDETREAEDFLTKLERGGSLRISRALVENLARSNRLTYILSVRGSHGLGWVEQAWLRSPVTAVEVLEAVGMDTPPRRCPIVYPVGPFPCERKAWHTGTCWPMSLEDRNDASPADWMPA